MIFQGHQNHIPNQNSKDHQFTDVQSMLHSYSNLTFKSLHKYIQKNPYCLGELKSNIFIPNLKWGEKSLWKVNHFQLEEKTNIKILTY